MVYPVINYFQQALSVYGPIEIDNVATANISVGRIQLPQVFCQLSYVRISNVFRHTIWECEGQTLFKLFKNHSVPNCRNSYYSRYLSSTFQSKLLKIR